MITSYEISIIWKMILILIFPNSLRVSFYLNSFVQIINYYDQILHYPYLYPDIKVHDFNGENHIIYDYNDKNRVIKMYECRTHLHKNYYQHKDVIVAVEQ